MPLDKLQQMVYASLMAALTAVGAYIYVPIGPVPIVLQNLFVFLTGLLLGSRWGLTSIAIYLLVGAMGIPVFSGGKGGIAHFVGPTGGYLFGFVLATFASGLLTEHSRDGIMRDIVAVVLASILIYGCGVPWLKVVTGMTWSKAFMAGLLPFVAGDAVKACIAVIVARAVRPIMKRQLQTASV